MYLFWLLSESLQNISLPAPTALHHHVLVLLVHHIIGRVNVQNTDGAESGRDAAGRWRGSGIHGVHESLDDGVIGRLQMRADGKVADAVAVEGLVLQRCDDPVVPAHFLEVDVQLLAVAPLFGVLGCFFPTWQRCPTHPPLGEEVLVDGLVVVTRTGFDLVVKEPSLLRSAKHNKEGFFLILPSGPTQAE